MEGFDPISMTYMATNFEPVDNTAPATNIYNNMMMMPNDFMEQYSTYDSQTIYPGDEYYQLPPPQTTPSLKRFSSTFDDAFSDAVGAFDTIAETGTQDVQDTQDAKEIAIEQGHRYLKFAPPVYDFALLDYNFRQVSVSLTADLLGLFFTEKSAWASQKPAENTELMCYRRNIFQVSGSVVVPRALRNIVTEQTEQISIVSQELVISATESAEGSPTKIICVPWKTPPNGNTAVEERAEKEPPSIPLDLSTASDGDSSFATFPFHWKRLQFRSATANNGRRKELQQHFVVHLKVVATLATGGKVTICHTKSNPIVVRGRSPRNFQSRKDILLTGNGTHAKKPTTSAPKPRAPSQVDHGHARKPSRSSVAPRNETPAVAASDNADFQMPALYNNTFQQGAMTAIPPTARISEPKDYAVSSPDIVRQRQPSNMPAPARVPLKLSLTDEEEPKQSSMTPPKNGNAGKRVAAGRAASTPSAIALQVGSSPDESADLLYEYFPLSLDDWQPPVDAVYRPHVVHHINPLPENKARDRLSRLKNKRYFSEDVG